MNGIYIVDTSKEINCNTRLRAHPDHYSPDTNLHIIVDWVFKDNPDKVISLNVRSYKASHNMFAEYLTQLHGQGKLLQPSDWFPCPDTTWVSDEGKVL